MVITKRIPRRLGRRGSVLLLYSVAWAALGLKGFLSPSDDDGRFVLYSLLLPSWARLFLWGVPVAFGIYSAFRDRDSMGFAALTIPPTALAVSYFGSTVGYFLGYTDYSAGWARGLSWAVLVIILLIISGWEEPPKPLPDGMSREDIAKGSTDAS